MKKQYAVMFRNTNSRLSQVPRYLVSVECGRANKTINISDAKIFSTKADARNAIANISKNNLYHVDVSIVII